MKKILGGFFEEHMYGERKDEIRERERIAKDRHKKNEDLYKAMNERDQGKMEKMEIRLMKQFAKVLAIGLVGAFLLEKLSDS